MTQRVGLLNGENLTFDSDISTPTLAILNEGVINGLEVKDSLVTKGKALIKVKRDNNQEVMVNFELTKDLNIDTSGTKSVYVEINSKAVNDGSLNSEDGTGIGEIKIGAQVPLKNAIKLANISNNIIEDKRVFIDIKDKFNLTKMGNEFNKANTLLKLDENGKLPVISGERLTNIKSENKNFITDFTAGESVNITKETAVCIKDGKIYIADKDILGKKNFIGFVKENLVLNQKCKVIYSGSIDGLENLNIGKKYYIGNNGEIEENGNFEDYIGFAISENILKLEDLGRNNITLKNEEFPISTRTETITDRSATQLSQGITLNGRINKIGIKREGKLGSGEYDGNLVLEVFKREGHVYNDRSNNKKVGRLSLFKEGLKNYKIGDYIEVDIDEGCEGEYWFFMYDGGYNKLLFNSGIKTNKQVISCTSGRDYFQYSGDYIHLKMEYNSGSDDIYGIKSKKATQGSIALGKAEGFLSVKINGEEKKIPYYGN